MAFKFLHVGKTAIKFDFLVCSVDVEQSSLAGKLLSLRFSRGSKKAAASRNVVADAAGHACWADEVLQFTATLFRSDSHSKFDGKDYKLSVDEVVRAGATQSAGSAKFDLAKYVDLKLGSSQSLLDLNLEKGAKGGRVRLVLKSWPSDSGPRNNMSSSDLGSQASLDTSGHGSVTHGPPSSDRHSQERIERLSPPRPAAVPEHPHSSSSLSARHLAEPASKASLASSEGGRSDESLPQPHVKAANGSKPPSDASSDAPLPQRRLRRDASNANTASSGSAGGLEDAASPAVPAPVVPSRPSRARAGEDGANGVGKDRGRPARVEEGGEGAGRARGKTAEHGSELGKAVGADGGGEGAGLKEGGRERESGQGQQGVEGGGFRGEWSVGRREKAQVQEMVARALRAVEEQERVLQQLATQREEDVFACDVALLLESCVLNLALPEPALAKTPASTSTASIQSTAASMQSDKSGGRLRIVREGSQGSLGSVLEEGQGAGAGAGAWTHGAQAWVLGQFMLHHGMLRAEKKTRRGEGARGEGGAETAARRREYFFERLVRAAEGATERVDPAGRVGRWLLTNLVLLRELVGVYLSREEGGGGKAVPGLKEVWKGLDRSAQGLYGRVEERERGEAERVARVVLAACEAAAAVPGSGGPGAAAVERAVGEVEGVLDGLAVRMRGEEVLPWVGRGVMEAGVTALDLALADGLGGGEEGGGEGGQLCCFESALVVKEVIGRVERWSRRHILQGKWAEGGGAVRVGLALARQSADVVMLEKTLLAGPDAAEFHAQICPDLSRARILRLVTRFRPDPSAPDKVPPSLLAELRAAAEEEEGRRRKGGGHVGNGSVKAKVLKGLPLPLLDEREAVKVVVEHIVSGAGRSSPATFPLLQGRQSLRFLWPASDEGRRR